MTPPQTRDSGDKEESTDFVWVARTLIPVPGELEILRARLSAEGIPSFIADGNTNGMNGLWSIALGGARLMVAREYAAAAREIIALVRSGAFELRDDEDPC